MKICLIYTFLLWGLEKPTNAILFLDIFTDLEVRDADVVNINRIISQTSVLCN